MASRVHCANTGLENGASAVLAAGTTGAPPGWRGPGSARSRLRRRWWGLLGPVAIAVYAVVLSAPVWITWYWLVRRG